MPARRKISVVAEYEDGSELISARDALDLILPYVDTELEGKEAIADGLRSGKVRAGAALVWEATFGDIYGPWEPRGATGGRTWEEIVVADEFKESRQWPAELHHWRWDAGDFIIFISEANREHLHRMYLKGVMISREDVLKLVGKTVRAGVGGAPRRSDDWRKFWHAVIQIALEQNLRSGFSSQAKLRQRILDVSKDALSEDAIKDEVREIWNKFVVTGL